MTLTIITATPPTPNGDLHVGHLSGPYLAADVHTRFLRSRGENALYVSSSDDNQSYVVTTARRMHVDPKELAGMFANQIRQTLQKASIRIDAFTEPDQQHSRFVQKFFYRLFTDKVLTRKKKNFLWCPTHKQYLFESYLQGYCYRCFSPTAGAICEACGHPNDADTILDPKCSQNPHHALERREVEVIVLELERFRPALERFYSDKSRSWRPHVIQLVDELLAGQLIDYPITYPSTWGVPSPFPSTSGQVLNVWAEMLPGLMRTCAHAESLRRKAKVDEEALWHPSAGNRLIQFLGYDNSFFFAVVHVILGLAAETRCILPASILTNEFYQLENFKFSTSKNHAIWARDLLLQRPVDQVRLYLALSNPGYQKTNFTLHEMDKLIEANFTKPWMALVSGLGSLSGRLARAVEVIEVSEDTRALMAELVATFERFYRIETFNLQRVGEQFTQLIAWLAARAREIATTLERRDGRNDCAQVCAILRLVPSLIFPLLPDFAMRLDEALRQTTCEQWPQLARYAATQPIPPLESVLRSRLLVS